MYKVSDVDHQVVCGSSTISHADHVITRTKSKSLLNKPCPEGDRQSGDRHRRGNEVAVETLGSWRYCARFVIANVCCKVLQVHISPVDLPIDKKGQSRTRQTFTTLALWR